MQLFFYIYLTNQHNYINFNMYKSIIFTRQKGSICIMNKLTKNKNQKTKKKKNSKIKNDQ